MERTAIYCGECFGFRGYRPGWTGDVIEWITCDWCVANERRKQAEVERLELLWASRQCAAPACSVVFAPAHPKQRFHDDRCRKRTHRRMKALRLQS
jgi:hypothetical protein